MNKLQTNNATNYEKTYKKNMLLFFEPHITYTYLNK